jgi:hypothetical protein
VLLGWIVFALALVLTTVENIHGPPVFTGAVVDLAWSVQVLRGPA